MELKINSALLAVQIEKIIGFVPSKSILPIITNILFAVKNQTLTLSATDLEHSISASCPIGALPETDISVAIPPKILLDTLKALDEQILTITVAEYVFQIEAEKSKFKINVQNGKDFPEPTVDKETLISFAMTTDAIIRATQSTVFAVAKDELKPAMTGVYMKVEREQITFVTTDAHRLVYYKYLDFNCDLPGDINDKAIIISHKTLNQIVKDAPKCGSDCATFSFNDKFVSVVLGDVRISSRLIDARFPTYENVIPASSPMRVILNRADALAAVKRIGIYASKQTHLLRFNFGERLLEISADEADTSETGAHGARETVQCMINGETNENGSYLEIGFNAALAAEIFNNVSNAEIVMELATPGRAAVVKPAEQLPGEYLEMLLMPIMLGASY